MKSPLVPPRHVSRQPNCWRCERQQELYMTSPKCWTQVPNNACASCCGCKLPGLFHHWRLSVPRSWRISLRSLPSAAGRPARAAKPLPASPGVHSIPLSKWQDQLMLRREWLRRNPMKAGSKGDSCLRQQKNLLQCPAFGQDEWHTYCCELTRSCVSEAAAIICIICHACVRSHHHAFRLTHAFEVQRACVCMMQMF